MPFHALVRRQGAVDHECACSFTVYGVLGRFDYPSEFIQAPERDLRKEVDRLSGSQPEWLMTRRSRRRSLR